MASYVSHLESAVDGTRFEFGQIHTTHEGRPLWVAYDLKEARKRFKRADLVEAAPDMWRYAPLLPTGDQVISLGEVITPLLPCPRLAVHLGVKQIYIKDESRLPTGSFKARGMAVAITMACGLGASTVAVPTQGNAGGAAAAYAARAGLDCYVFMPEDAPEVNRVEAALFGAKVYLVDGLIGDCGKLVREGVVERGWYDLSTLREPYRLEGKKTMGYELAEQMGWRLPGAIFYPTGGGTGLIGMWKAFQELTELGWLETGHWPKMFACQSTGCAPLVSAWESGERHAEPPQNVHTIAAGLRVPQGIGDFMILDAVRASGGAALAAAEDGLVSWMHLVTELEGISLCPEAAACVGGLELALGEGRVRPDETIVIFNTCAAQKHIEVLRRDIPKLGPGDVDWAELD
ncbi:MAG: threonine synthase [Planctomycetota bacterium]|jgi:threonine synthase